MGYVDRSMYKIDRLNHADLDDNLHLTVDPAIVIDLVWPLCAVDYGKLSGGKIAVPNMDDVIARIEETGRSNALVQALLGHPSNYETESDRRWARLAEAVADPMNAEVPFTQLCNRFKIQQKDIVPYFADHQRAAALLETMELLPVLAKQVMQSAMMRQGPCPDCGGEGYFFRVMRDEEGNELRNGKFVKKRKVRCVHCKGVGEVLIEPRGEAIDRAMEMSGLITKDRAPLVAVQQNFNGPALEETVADIGKLLTTGGREGGGR